MGWKLWSGFKAELMRNHEDDGSSGSRFWEGSGERVWSSNEAEVRRDWRGTVVPVRCSFF